jgi:hypothetical protein
MRFTPTAFIGSAIGGSLVATATGAESGSFTSGGINYGFFKFTTGSATLTIGTGANLDILLVGGGGGGNTGSVLQATTGIGGGGGGVNLVSTRLLRGSYTINVGTGGTPNENGQATTLTGYNLVYTAGFGRADGVSGAPQGNSGGTGIGNCGSAGTSAGGGGGSSAATGSSPFCPGNNIPNGANGGQGLTYNFDGTASVYGSGGGGGGGTQAFSQGGTGGTNAGNGAPYNDFATNATNGFGGGGGGERAGNPNQAGTGGNGTLIIRYTIQ